MPKNFQPPQSIAASLTNPEPTKPAAANEWKPTGRKKAKKKQIISFTLTPEHVQVIKKKAYQMSSPEKNISASQALSDILEEYIGYNQKS